MVSFRLYIEAIEENLQMYNHLSRPPKYVRYTPVLFDVWSKWAEKQAVKYEEKDKPIIGIGTKVAPTFVEYEFKDLEAFFKHYKSITTEI